MVHLLRRRPLTNEHKQTNKQKCIYILIYLPRLGVQKRPNFESFKFRDPELYTFYNFEHNPCNNLEAQYEVIGHLDRCRLESEKYIRERYSAINLFFAYSITWALDI